jgi:hypothetical protein
MKITKLTYDNMKLTEFETVPGLKTGATAGARARATAREGAGNGGQAWWRWAR